MHLARRQSDAAALETARNSRAQARNSQVSGSYCALPCGSCFRMRSPAIQPAVLLLLPRRPFGWLLAAARQGASDGAKAETTPAEGRRITRNGRAAPAGDGAAAQPLGSLQRRHRQRQGAARCSQAGRREHGGAPYPPSPSPLAKWLPIPTRHNPPPSDTAPPRPRKRVASACGSTCSIHLDAAAWWAWVVDPRSWRVASATATRRC